MKLISDVFCIALHNNKSRISLKVCIRTLHNQSDFSWKVQRELSRRANLARFPYNPILHYAYSSLLKENNSANNRLPLGLYALFYKILCFFSKSFFKRIKNRRFEIKNTEIRRRFCSFFTGNRKYRHFTKEKKLIR